MTAGVTCRSTLGHVGGYINSGHLYMKHAYADIQTMLMYFQNIVATWKSDCHQFDFGIWTLSSCSCCREVNFPFPS